MKEQETERRRTPGTWVWLSGAFAAFACVATLLSFVVVGPLTVELQPGEVLPSVAPTEDPAPAPAVTASPADVAAATVIELFDAPDVVVVPPPPPPAPPSSRRVGGGTTTATGAYKTYTEYCSAPDGPYSTSSADVSALLTLVNKERARIGLSGLSWSSSLASTATSWSQTMAANDDATPDVLGDALAHGMQPSPGGQNVAMNWRLPTFYTATESMNIAHYNWVYSYGHCTNLMRPGWTVMGAGGAQSAGGAWYWTQNFQ